MLFRPSNLRRKFFLRYGYEKESQVISIIFLAIDDLRTQNAKTIYGYDYAENFLILVQDLTEAKIDTLLEKLTERINKILEEHEIDIDFFPPPLWCLF